MTAHECKCECGNEFKEYWEQIKYLEETNSDLIKPMTSLFRLINFFKKGFVIYGINEEGVKYCKFMIGDKEPDLIIRLSDLIHEHEQKIIKAQEGKDERE